MIITEDDAGDDERSSLTSSVPGTVLSALQIRIHP